MINRKKINESEIWIDEKVLFWSFSTYSFKKVLFVEILSERNEKPGYVVYKFFSFWETDVKKKFFDAEKRNLVIPLFGKCEQMHMKQTPIRVHMRFVVNTIFSVNGCRPFDKADCKILSARKKENAKCYLRQNKQRWLLFFSKRTL